MPSLELESGAGDGGFYVKKFVVGAIGIAFAVMLAIIGVLATAAWSRTVDAVDDHEKRVLGLEQTVPAIGSDIEAIFRNQAAIAKALKVPIEYPPPPSSRYSRKP